MKDFKDKLDKLYSLVEKKPYALEAISYEIEMFIEMLDEKEPLVRIFGVKTATGIETRCKEKELRKEAMVLFDAYPQHKDNLAVEYPDGRIEKLVKG